MRPLYFTLAAEGSTDEMLLPILRWVFEQQFGPDVPVNGSFSSYRGDIAPRISRAMREFPDTDLLLVHADGGKEGHHARAIQIDAAIAGLTATGRIPPHARVIPVRESEAWLLFDDAAIRTAAANPNGKLKLKLVTRDYDRVADPKLMLNDALDAASGLTGRKLANFKRDRRPIWVADCVSNFAPLRTLEAFATLESEIAKFSADWMSNLTAEGEV
jgi:hypothetical protein